MRIVKKLLAKEHRSIITSVDNYRDSAYNSQVSTHYALLTSSVFKIFSRLTFNKHHLWELNPWSDYYKQGEVPFNVIRPLPNVISKLPGA